MELDVMQVGILCMVLAFARQVNEIIETPTIRIAGNYCLELIFVQTDQFADGFG
jgi:hypothetical protein